MPLAQFAEPAFLSAGGVAFAAAVSDLLTRRIPNALTYGGLSLGLVLGIWPGVMPDLLPCLAGMAVAFVPGLLMFSVGSIGGGDVKLLAALGALLGTPLILDVLLASVVFGTLLGLVWLIRYRRLAATLRGLGRLARSLAYPGVDEPVPARDLHIPMGLAIALGTFYTLLLPDYRAASPLLGG